MKYECRATRLTISPEGWCYSGNTNESTEIELDQESSAFVTVSQGGEALSITPEEWPLIRDCVDKLMAIIQEQNK